jgi:hypothetical protein
MCCIAQIHCGIQHILTTMATPSGSIDWQSLAEQAGKATNPEQLASLVEQLWFVLPGPNTNKVSHRAHRASLRRVRHSALLHTVLSNFNFVRVWQTTVRRISSATPKSNGVDDARMVLPAITF